MAYEGNKKVVLLRGVERAGADNLQEAGGLEQCVGMEFKDGSLVPYAMKELSGSGATILRGYNVKKILVHKTSNQTNIIIQHVLSSNNHNRIAWVKKEVWDGEESDSPVVHNILDTEKEIFSIEQVGNMLCVSMESGIEDFLWDGSIYKEKSNVENIVPTVRFRVTKGLYDEDYADYIGINDYSTQKIVGWSNIREHLIAEAVKCIGIATQKGGITGCFLVSGAWRLKNGSFVCASPIVLLNAPDVANEGYFYGYNYVTQTEEKVVNASIPSGVKIENTDYILTPAHIWNGALDLDYEFLEYTQVKTCRLCTRAYPITNKAPQHYVYPPLLSVMFQAHNDGSTVVDGDWLYDTRMVGSVTVNKLQYKIDSIPAGLEDEISSFCIFISPQVNVYRTPDGIEDVNMNWLYKTAEEGELYDGQDYTGHLIVKDRDIDSIKDDISNISNLYKVKEIPISQLQSSSWIDVDLKGKLGDYLLTRETLPLTAFYRTSGLAGSILFNYNMRLHVGNYMQNIFRGYSIEDYQHNGGWGQYPSGNTLPNNYAWEIDIEISDDDNSSRRVVRYMTGQSGTNYNDELSPLLFFPDVNATKIRFYIRDEVSGDTYTKEYSMLRWNNMQGAYYISNDLKPIWCIQGGTEVAGEIPIEENKNTMRIVKNGLRASDVAYPSYFPASMTYRIGNGEIVGLAVLANALSQDITSPQPLLIFCTDGIWSMAVDQSGNGAYSNILPFSREVCINKKSICPIDGAVLFASEHGLMIANRNGVAPFVEALNGKIRNFRFGSTDYGFAFKYFTNAIKHEKILDQENFLEVGGEQIFDADDFRDYLKEATVSYVSNKKKAIVYRDDKDYVYWIDIPTKNATSLPVKIALDDDNYPVENYYSGSDILLALNEMPEDKEVPCYLQTRPYKLQDPFDSVQRVMLRGKFSNMESVERHAGMYVAGSIDGEHWRLMGYCEKSLDEAGFHDFGCKTTRETVKYLMVVVMGYFDCNTHIDGMELTLTTKYNNKLK